MLAAAFPGTPVHARDLTSGTSSSERTWFSIDLLQFLLFLRKNNPRITIESTAKTIFEMHRRNSGEQILQEDTLRKLLAKTLDEYENAVVSQLLTVLEVSEEPQGPGGCVRACPACASLTGNYLTCHHFCLAIHEGSLWRLYCWCWCPTGQEKYTRSISPGQYLRGQILTAERDISADKDIFRLHSIYADGNFRLRHENGRGKATKHDAPIQNIFVKKVKHYAALLCTKKLSACWIPIRVIVPRGIKGLMSKPMMQSSRSARSST